MENLLLVLIIMLGRDFWFLRLMEKLFSAQVKKKKLVHPEITNSMEQNTFLQAQLPRKFPFRIFLT
jgi:hypothetical protein